MKLHWFHEVHLHHRCFVMAYKIVDSLVSNVRRLSGFFTKSSSRIFFVAEISEIESHNCSVTSCDVNYRRMFLILVSFGYMSTVFIYRDLYDVFRLVIFRCCLKVNILREVH